MLVAAAVIVAAAAAVAAERLWRGDFVWGVWADRDLARSAVAWTDLAPTGAELSYGAGARTPGGAFGYLLWPLQGHGPRAAWLAQITLDTLAAALVGGTVARRLGPWGGAVAFATWLSIAPNAMNQTQLWNPAWLSIFLAVATVAWARVIVVKDARAMIPWAAALALGAQMHVTSGVLALAMLPGILLARPPHLWRGIAGALLAAVAMYAPYLVHEARNGFPNTHLLMAAEQIEDLTTPLVSGSRPAGTLWSAILTLGGGPAIDSLPRSLPRAGVWAIALAGPVLGAIAILWSKRRERDEVRNRLRRAVVLGLVVAFVLVSRSRAYQFQTANTSRYLIFVVPLIAWLAALAADAVVRALATRPVLRAVAVALVTTSVGVRLLAFHTFTSDIQYRPLSWTHVARWTRILADRGQLDEAPSNTTFLSAGQALTREKAVPIESLRAVPDHEILPVAPSEPCRFVAAADWPDPELGARITVASLTAALAPDGPRAVDLVVEIQEPGLAIGTWIPDVGPCPANLTQRYLLTPDEQITATRGSAVKPDGAVRLDDEGGRRWLVAFDPSHGEMHPTPVVYGLLTIAQGGEDVEIALSSNQLRGIAWNGGFFENDRVRNIRVAATDVDGGDHEITLASGVVGGTGVSTPLFARGVAAPDARFTLRVDLQPAALVDEKAHDGPVTTLEIALP